MHIFSLLSLAPETAIRTEELHPSCDCPRCEAMLLSKHVYAFVMPVTRAACYTSNQLATGCTETDTIADVHDRQWRFLLTPTTSICDLHPPRYDLKPLRELTRSLLYSVPTVLVITNIPRQIANCEWRMRTARLTWPCSALWINETTFPRVFVQRSWILLG
jgi:hypothetical protein